MWNSHVSQMLFLCYNCVALESSYKVSGKMHYWQHCSVFWGRDKMSGLCSLKMSLRTTWWLLPFLPITVKNKTWADWVCSQKNIVCKVYWLPWWFGHLWSKLCFRYFMSLFVWSNISLWEHLNYVKPKSP